ncbi:hypothetical protein ACSFCX_10310 [Yokenella regensburgei]|uniref:hypothetical protein n=1 Tax=Yokenella regensburgei TaxID=158877 RepID=UPI003EDB07F9
MTNNNLTETRLAEIAEDGFLEHGDAKKMAAELQQYRKAAGVPVAWTDAEELRDINNGYTGYLFAIGGEANKFADPRRQIMLYTVPPASVVPDEIDVNAPSLDTHRKWMAEGWNRCRAVMLKNVSFRKNGNSSTETLREISKTSTTPQVIPDSYLLVPVKETLEMAVAGDRVYELCVERDEYPTDAARRIWAAMVAAAPLQGDAPCTK